jgi:hypothetical protein
VNLLKSLDCEGCYSVWFNFYPVSDCTLWSCFDYCVLITFLVLIGYYVRKLSSVNLQLWFLQMCGRTGVWKADL